MAFRPVLHYVAAALVLLLISCLGSVAAVTDAQKLATYHFLQNFSASIPDLSSAWTGDDYSGWTGISVDSDGYVTLDLASRGLSGTLFNNSATEDGILVKSLDLSGNPNLIGVFDDSWAKMKFLTYLDLSNTGLLGHIPSSWNGMVSLTTVKIANVNACGGLPDWNIAKLQTVDFSNAALRGTLAYSWARMTGLTSVTFTGNNFCGCVPTNWITNTVLMNAVSGMNVASSSCSGITCIGAYICYVGTSSTTSSTAPSGTTTTTTLPSGVSGATLVFLQNLAANVPTLSSAWTGNDYRSWTGITVDASGYVTVDLSGRGLSGTLPSNAATREGILVTKLDLSNNPNLVGRFDDSWAKLTLLETLDLSHTGLYGYIPDSWNGMVSLTSVKISNVEACGGLPNWSLVGLKTIDLSNAALRGALASSWVEMISLTSVDISGNNFCSCEPVVWKVIPILHNAVSGMAVTSSTCGTNNTCATSYICYVPTTTKQPGSAAFGSAAVASFVTVATLILAALIA